MINEQTGNEYDIVVNGIQYGVYADEPIAFIAGVEDEISKHAKEYSFE